MRYPAVTIGISFRDPGPDLVLAVQSVFAQSFADWELILCDDGSTDGSLSFVQRLCDPRVRVISDGRRETLAIRLNQMVAMSRASFFFRMDADDIMHPERVEKQLTSLAHHPGAVVGSSAYAIDKQSRVTGLKLAALRQCNGFAGRHSFFHPTVAASVAWFRYNPYSQHPVYYRAEDAELWCRTASRTPFVWIPEPLMFVREAGVFSYSKHLGTSLGILHLAIESSRGTTERLYLTTRELAKIWLTLTADAFGHSDWLVRRRAVSLSEPERRRADEIVERIRRQEFCGAVRSRSLAADQNAVPRG